jgi:hypothetical protein
MGTIYASQEKSSAGVVQLNSMWLSESHDTSLSLVACTKESKCQTIASNLSTQETVDHVYAVVHSLPTLTPKVAWGVVL